MTEERIPFRAEVARLLDIVVHSLYSDKEIFLRELISNASDACDRLRYESLTRPELIEDDPAFKIQITTDKKARTITVSDNGIGMTRDELIENLGTIARSGTLDFLTKYANTKKPDINIIGQFGVGFYASFMVAQMVEVRSRKAGSEEAFCWRSDGKGEFSIEEDKRNTRGTDVILYLKQGEDEFLSEDRLRFIIRRYSDHISLPIYLNDDSKPVNRGGALWLRPKSEITQEQYKEFYHHVAHSFEEPALVIHWKAEGKIEYSALLFIPGIRPYDLFEPSRKHGVRLYVKRVFITASAEGLIPGYLRFLRGVVDSEDLPLNISREMLQHTPMLAKIRQGIIRRVLGEIAKFAENDEKAFAAFWENFGIVLKEGLYEDSEHRPELLKVLRCRSTHGEGLVSLADYTKRMRPGQENIYYLNGDNINTIAHSPHLEGFKARGIEVLLLTDAVDDFWPMAVGEYEGKKFKSVTRAGEELNKIPLLEEKKQQAEKKPSAPQAELDGFIAMIKSTLGDKIKDARTSERLIESPVCLATEEGDIDIHLEKFLKQHGQIKTPSRRILEINPKHELIKKLAERAKDRNARADIEDAIWLLLDQALLLEGESIPDPTAFSRRLAEFMTRVL